MGKELLVITDNPFEQLTVKKRIRQLLHTHQGRDKLFKVAQYLLRIKMWFEGVNSYSPLFSSNLRESSSSLTTAERNLMTIINSRRMFRVGRFVGEFVRLRVTLIKVSEILVAPSNSRLTSLFLQTQMLLDIVARVIMLAKSVMEDVAYTAQKGFLRSNVGERLVPLTIKLSIPVLLVDLLLNTLRLLQGVQDARAPAQEPQRDSLEDSGSAPAGGAAPLQAESVAGSGTGGGSEDSSGPLLSSKSSFSLLSKYNAVDKLRRRSGAASPLPASSSRTDLFAAGSTGCSTSTSRSDLAVMIDTGDAAVLLPQPLSLTPPPAAPLASALPFQPPHCSPFGDESGVSSQKGLTSDVSSGSGAARGPDVSSTARLAPVATRNERGVVEVDSYAKLFWADFELHWVFVTELKLLLDIFVTTSLAMESTRWKGPVSWAGLVSGLLSVYRVWTYGR
jgi:hypothetical protein